MDKKARKAMMIAALGSVTPASDNILKIYSRENIAVPKVLIDTQFHGKRGKKGKTKKNWHK